jgi:hypothetical protein
MPCLPRALAFGTWYSNSTTVQQSSKVNRSEMNGDVAALLNDHTTNEVGGVLGFSCGAGE